MQQQNRDGKLEKEMVKKKEDSSIINHFSFIVDRSKNKSVFTGK
jgi:hypothetical protein